MNQASAVLAILFIALVPFAAAGSALINTGLGRSRSAAHTMLASLCLFAVAVLVYFAIGFAWEGFPGRPAYVFTAAGREWNWLAAEPFFLRGLDLDASPASVAAWLQMLAVGVAALIPLGAAADRWRLGAACISTALLAGFVYPVFAHWSWGGGWLAQTGFLDAGGAGAIHALGGVTALSIVWIVGPRRGKYAADGLPAAIPGHNGVLVLLGCFLALLGWLGLDCAGALILYGATPGVVVRAGVDTLLSGSVAALAAAGITRYRFGRPDASLCANGWVGGLVSASAGCAVLSPAAAVLTGLGGGILVTLSVEWLDLHLDVDDPAGAVSVHACGGIWGLLAAGLFGPGTRQWVPQVIGIATLLGAVLPAAYILNIVLNRVLPQRVSAEGERQGMDLYELGAGAYPEFVIHREDFYQR